MFADYERHKAKKLSKKLDAAWVDGNTTKYNAINAKLRVLERKMVASQTVGEHLWYRTQKVLLHPVSQASILLGRNFTIGTVLYWGVGHGVMGMAFNLWSGVGLMMGAGIASTPELIQNHRVKKASLPKVEQPKLAPPTLNQNILDAQRNIAALDHKKYKPDLPAVPSGWSVEDQRAHNDLYWQGQDAFWLNPKVYEGGKMNLFAEETPAPEWWQAPTHDDVIPDQADLVKASLEDPNPKTSSYISKDYDQFTEHYDYETSDEYSVEEINELLVSHNTIDIHAGLLNDIICSLKDNADHLKCNIVADHVTAETIIHPGRPDLNELRYEVTTSDGEIMVFDSLYEANECVRKWTKSTSKRSKKK